MKVIGLTGGIATGKSEVTNILRHMNIPVFDADAAVHEIYQNGTAAQHLKTICPQAIVGGIIDRQILSKLLVTQPELLTEIEALIHPLVRGVETNFIADAAKKNHRLIVIDSPLLVETGHHRDMDFSIMITSTIENQIKRAMARPDMTKAKLEFILAKQMPAAEKQKSIDLVIENNATLAELETKVRATFNKLLSN